MLNKKQAIETIKTICKEYEHLSLRVFGGVAAWTKKWDEMTFLDWKHIGYVSALAFAFEIEEVN